MSRCIDGVPLDELACQMAQMATVCDTSLDDATAPDMRDSEFVSEVELEWQDVLRCEADLDNAAAEYYDCGDYQSGIPSPDMTPKNTPVHSPDFSFRMTWDDGNARTSDDGNARGLTRGCVSGGAALGARPMSTALSRGQVDMLALPSVTDARFGLWYRCLLSPLSGALALALHRGEGLGRAVVRLKLLRSDMQPILFSFFFLLGWDLPE